jgi:hypothetical protein
LWALRASCRAAGARAGRSGRGQLGSPSTLRRRANRCGRRRRGRLLAGGLVERAATISLHGWCHQEVWQCRRVTCSSCPVADSSCSSSSGLSCRLARSNLQAGGRAGGRPSMARSNLRAGGRPSMVRSNLRAGGWPAMARSNLRAGGRPAMAPPPSHAHTPCINALAAGSRLARLARCAGGPRRGLA